MSAQWVERARSVLFVPGDRPERLTKARASGADLVIVDLEDAVSAEAKGKARQALQPGDGIAVRINASGTPWYKDDIAGVLSVGLGAVMAPKADAGSVEALARDLPSDVAIIALVETARGVLDAPRLAEAAGVARLVFGSVDYGLDTGISDTSAAMDHARSALVVASAAAGLPGPVDGVTLALDDPDQVADDAARAASLGMTGKLCIHPRQVAAVNAVFAPSEGALKEARALLAAAEAADKDGAFRFNGKIVDRPVLERARRLVGKEPAR